MEKYSEKNPENYNYEQDFLDIAEKLRGIFVKKNHDYGNAFIKSLDEDGLMSTKFRLGDKIKRFNNLSIAKSEEQLVKDESLQDTLIDTANYCIMTLMWMNNTDPEEWIKYIKKQDKK